jgi:rod shape-determining protein MreB and related proteins
MPALMLTSTSEQVSLLSRKIGIDLGSSTVRIYVKGEGVVVNEPSQVTLGRERALRQLITKAQGRPRLFKPEVVLSVTSDVTSAERRVMAEAAISAGARQAWLIDEPLAAAIGAGLPIAEERACAVCEIGGGSTEIAVISLSGMVVARSLRVGGDRIDDAIAAHLAVDSHTAEGVKRAIGSAMPMQTPLVMQVQGREVSSNDVAEAIGEPLRLIAEAVRDVLAETPPALAADLRERGIVLSGGGAQLREIDRYISTHAGIRAVVGDEPQTLVVRGTGLALESFEVLKRNHSYLR